MLSLVVDAFHRTRFAADLADRLPGPGGLLAVGGLAGSSAAVMAAWLVRQRPTQLVVVVAATPADAERWLADLTHLTGLPAGL